MAAESGLASLADGESMPTAAAASVPWQAPSAPTADEQSQARFARQFTAEWAALLSGLLVLGALIGWSLFKAHETVDATERDRLRVQARVVDDNVGQQLDGMNGALASVRDEFLSTPGPSGPGSATGSAPGPGRRARGRPRTSRRPPGVAS